MCTLIIVILVFGCLVAQRQKIIEFIKKHINTDKIYKQVLHKKIMMLYESLGWSEPTDASKTIERFF